MPFLTIAFPVFDPIAIAIGPIAIRWYALADSAGSVPGGRYRPRADQAPAALGRPGADGA